MENVKTTTTGSHRKAKEAPETTIAALLHGTASGPYSLVTDAAKCIEM